LFFCLYCCFLVFLLLFQRSRKEGMYGSLYSLQMHESARVAKIYYEREVKRKNVWGRAIVRYDFRTCCGLWRCFSLFLATRYFDVARTYVVAQSPIWAVMGAVQLTRIKTENLHQIQHGWYSSGNRKMNTLFEIDIWMNKKKPFSIIQMGGKKSTVLNGTSNKSKETC
jgi:hypothetical protein